MDCSNPHWRRYWFLFSYIRYVSGIGNTRLHMRRPGCGSSDHASRSNAFFPHNTFKGYTPNILPLLSRTLEVDFPLAFLVFGPRRKGAFADHALWPLIDDTFLHDKQHRLKCFDILQWIAFDCHNVRQHSRL